MSSLAPGRPRDVGIDVLRIVAICLVVIAHVWTDNSALRSAVYLWHVPIFFFLSGYLARSDRSFGHELGTRWRTLGLPYVSWLVIISAALVVLALPGPVALPWQAILWGGSGVGRPFSTFWFVGALFAAALAYRLIARLPWWAQLLVAILGYAAALVVPDAVRWVPLGLGLGLACLIFVVAGAGFRRIVARIPARVPLALVGLLVAAGMVVAGLARPLDLKQADVGTPVVSLVVSVLVCACLTVLAEAAFAGAGARLSALTTWAARAGLIVVLVHPLFLYVLATPPAGSLGAAVITLGGSWLVGLLIVLTPAAPILGGVPRLPLSALRVSAAR